MDPAVEQQLVEAPPPFAIRNLRVEADVLPGLAENLGELGVDAELGVPQRHRVAHLDRGQLLEVRVEELGALPLELAADHLLEARQLLAIEAPVLVLSKQHHEELVAARVAGHHQIALGQTLGGDLTQESTEIRERLDACREALGELDVRGNREIEQHHTERGARSELFRN